MSKDKELIDKLHNENFRKASMLAATGLTSELFNISINDSIFGMITGSLMRRLDRKLTIEELKIVTFLVDHCVREYEVNLMLLVQSQRRAKGGV